MNTIFRLMFRKIHLFSFALLLSSCSTTKYISKTHSTQIKKETTLLLPSYSSLALVSEKNELMASDSLVEISDKIMNSALGSIANSIGITQPTNSHISSHEINYLTQECQSILQYYATKIKPQDKKRLLSSYVLDSKIDSIMSQIGIETVILFVHSGFKRTKQNKVKQGMKSLGVGLLTLGMYVPISYPFSSNIEVLTLSKGKGVSFYNSNLAQKDPTEDIHIERRICELVQGYLSKKTNSGNCFYSQSL